MYKVSQAYKEQTKKPIKNQSYMRVSLGLINQEAQASADVENQSQYTLYSDFPTVFTKNDIGNIYATFEQDFFTADGSMYFIPKDSDNYRKNGLITNNLFSGAQTIQFSFGYGASDIRGLTVQFGHNYPTKFSVITDDGTEVEFENDSDFFETETVFENTSTITMKIKEMNVPNNRIRLYYVKFGLGLEYDNEWIQSADSSPSRAILHSLAQLVKKHVRQLVGHVQTPAVGAQLQPAAGNAAGSGKIVPAGGILLVEPGQNPDAPPAIIIVREMAEGVPIRIGRVLRLVGTHAGVMPLAVEIAAVRPGVIEYPVQNDPHPPPVRFGHKL